MMTDKVTRVDLWAEYLMAQGHDRRTAYSMAVEADKASTRSEAEVLDGGRMVSGLSAGPEAAVEAAVGRPGLVMMGPHTQAHGTDRLGEVVGQLPPGTVFMAIDNWELLKAVKLARPDLVTVSRHWMDQVQVFPTDWSLADFEDHVRNVQLSRFRPALEIYSDYVDLVLEQNEYNSESHGPEEVAARVRSVQAWNRVWAEEGWDQKARLVVGNSAIGNSIPLEAARATHDHGNVLGYHPYIPVMDGAIIAEDPVFFPDRPQGQWVHSWPWYHGRHEVMDRAFRAQGIFCDWVFTEGNPVGGRLWPDGGLSLFPNDGWKLGSVCGGVLDTLYDILIPWLDWLTYWNEDHGGRLIGCVAFTTGPWDWEWFQVNGWEWLQIIGRQATRQLGPLAWDGTSPSLPDDPDPPVEPPTPPTEECPPGSDARVDPVLGPYSRTVHVIPQGWPLLQKAAVATREWAINPGFTISGSYDDSGIGRGLKSRQAILHGLPRAQWPAFLDWYDEHYTGTEVTFKTLAPFIMWTLPFLRDDSVRLTQKWGVNQALYGPLGLPGHDGIDWAMAEGTPILAGADGKVASVVLESAGHSYGEHVRVNHRTAMGWIQTIYGHLQPGTLTVAEGLPVTAGQVLGLSGTSGRSTGPHLHLGMKWLARPYGAYSDDHGVWPYELIDPTPYVSWLWAGLKEGE